MKQLDGMAIFAKVVQAGSFTAAAATLGLSKSSVSKRISRLEDHLGARMLNRTTRRLNLTEVGAAYYQRCARILAEVEEAELAVTSLHAEPRGTIKVNAPVSFGIQHIAPAIPAFMERHPDLRVDIDLNDRMVDLIEEGYDVAVRILKLSDSTLIARNLAPFRRVVCASPGYWRRHPMPRTPQGLKGHNCLLYTYQQSQEEWRFQGPQGAMAVKVSGNLRANNGNVLLAAALGGSGVCVLPAFIAGGDLRAGRLVAALRDFEEADLSIYAVYPHARHLSAKVRALVDFLALRFGPRPDWEIP